MIKSEDFEKDLISRYRKDGFVYVPQVLSPDEVILFLREAKEMFDKYKQISWDDGSNNVMNWIADVEIKSEVLRKLVLHEKITTIAEKLSGINLRLLKSELLIKKAGKSAITPVHVDDYAFPVSDAAHTLTVWVALTDVPLERGALTFLPGSQRIVETTYKNQEEVRNDEFQDWSQEMMNPLQVWSELNWCPRITIPLKAGDCTIHHSKTVHMAGANSTDADRYSLATVYTDVNAKYTPVAFGGDENEEEYAQYQPESFQQIQPGQQLPDNKFPKVGSFLKY